MKTFSGGMRRRLEIARGFLHTPKILFLDEPTLGLDPQSRNQLWTHVKRQNETDQVTVFLTTHYMDEAERVADRIAVIDHGKIVAMGTSDELKQKTNAQSLEDAFLALTGIDDPRRGRDVGKTRCGRWRRCVAREAGDERNLHFVASRSEEIQPVASADYCIAGPAAAVLAGAWLRLGAGVSESGRGKLPAIHGAGNCRAWRCCSPPCFSGIALLWDRQFGFLKETLVAPVPRINVMIGRTLGGATVAMIQGTLILVVCLIAGFRPVSLIGDAGGIRRSWR